LGDFLILHPKIIFHLYQQPIYWQINDILATQTCSSHLTYKKVATLTSAEQRRFNNDLVKW